VVDAGEEFFLGGKYEEEAVVQVVLHHTLHVEALNTSTEDDVAEVQRYLREAVCPREE